MTFAILNLPCKTVVLKFFMYVVLLSIQISRSDLVVSFTQEYRSAVFLWKIVFGIPNEHTQSHSSFTAAHQTSIQLGAVGMWTRPTGARWRAGFRCGDTHGCPLWKLLESQFLWAPEQPRVLLIAQRLLVSFYFSQRADNRNSNNPVALNNVRFQGLELDAGQSELNPYFFSDYLCLQAQLNLSVSSFAEGEDYLVPTMQSCYED